MGVKLLTLEASMRRGMTSQRGAMRSSFLVVLIGFANVARYAGHTVPWWKPAWAVLLLAGCVSYAWNKRQESRKTFDIYEDRLRELLESTYHAITFADRDEAAAFVAALARQLHSPRSDLASWEEDVEISATSGTEGTTLYLSEGAMQAFTTAFAAPPGTRPIIGSDLPPERIPVLVGTSAEAIGLEEVVRRIEGTSPPHRA